MPDFRAPTKNIQVDQGDDETITLTRKDGNGNLVDINGFTFWLTIKNEKDDADADAEIQKQVASHTDSSNGETQFELSASDTESLTGKYVYDIQEKTDGGNINTLLKGVFEFRSDVTEATT